MKYSRSLVATLLMSGGLLQIVPSVLADIPTLKDTPISNTATASYDDPSGLSINATSNTVTVQVAEVAGIDVTASGITNVSTPGGAVKVNDNLLYNYNVTNVGNAPTTFHIPANPAITGPGTLGTAGVEYSVDGGTTWISASATPTTALIPVGGTVQVRVPVTATNAGTNGNVIKVQLGNTPLNAPNQPLSASGNSDDVNTVGGAPVNGQRESAAVQEIAVGAIVKNIALATVTEKRTNVTDNGTPSVVTDDIISYELGLKVADTDPTNSGITPVALTGTPVSVGGVISDRILVSSAIPAGTTFLAGSAAAPTGWKVVYTTDPTTVAANAANWSLTAPTTGVVTRIGYVNDLSVSTIVATGSTNAVNGLVFKVATTGATGAGYTVDSMAQAFGTTQGDTAKTVVYDESGDANPNNYDPATPATIPSPTVSALTAATAAGSADGVAIATYIVDAANDNSGTGVAGEINEYVYLYTAPTPNSLLNGPKDAATAIGPDNTTQTDFSNKSSSIPAGTAPGATIDPAPVGFFNTIQNTGTTPADIKLLPESVSGTNLPAGTKVRIYTTGASAQSATYVANGTGGFVFDPATATAGITATTPVTLPAVAVGGTAQYQVEIDLPTGTELSALNGKSFPVVIDAFTGGAVTATAAGEVSVAAPTAINKTIDRVYTGFVKLLKESRILPGTGPAVSALDGTFSIADKKPAPGNIIEYRITYSNISDKPVGTGNAVLNASNLTIVEDGTTATNKWGQDANTNGKIDTSNVVGTAISSEPTSTTQLFNGTNGNVGTLDVTGLTPATDVTKYVNSVIKVVTPGDSGTFTFQRKLN